MTEIYLLKRCFWGDFDIRGEEVISAHPSREVAVSHGKRLGLPYETEAVLRDLAGEDEVQEWYEVQRVSFLRYNP